jgi:adenosylhomocysteine nucleosidase
MLKNMKKVLIAYAVPEERIDIVWQDCHVEYVQTGIGKVKSAYHLTDAIDRFAPDIVVNIGTAGTVCHNVGDIFCCRRFVDRDMKPLGDLGLEYEILSDALLSERGLCTSWGATATCNTGDSFMTDTTGAVDGDVFDMEAYAQAYVCRERGIPFVSVKCVTDIIGRNSVKHWEDKLSDARQALTAHFQGIHI